MKIKPEDKLDMDDIFVSIIIPSYNSAQYIEETLESILSQSFKKYEAIIIDDFSTDNSVNIINKFVHKDSRFRLISGKEKAKYGAAEVRNIGINAARGRFIAFLDSDDLWKPDKLERQIDYMLINDVAFTYSNYDVWSERKGKITKAFLAKQTASYNSLLKSCYIGCLTVIYDSQKIGKVYMNPLAEKREDYACWLSILKTGITAHNVGENLAIYRIRKNSVSSSKIKMVKYQYRLFRNIERLSIFSSLWFLLTHSFNKIFKKY